MLQSLESAVPALLRQRPRHSRQLDWRKICANLGVVDLPTDYKILAEAYPPFVVDEFLNIYIPMIGREKEFCDGLLEDLDVLADLADCGESHGYVPYPSEGGLIPIAATYSGDQFYWRTAASEPDLWPIVISGANDDWWEFPGGVVSFLASWLGGTLERRGLPSGVPRAKPPVRLIE